MKEFLSQRGVAWTEKYVDTDRAAAVEMIRRSGQQGVPVTVIGDEVVVGFDRQRLERILATMSSNGGQKKSLGARVADASSFAIAGGTPVAGAYVGGVKPGTPAEVSGLKIGDVIVAVDGREVRSADDLASVIESSSGGTLRLVVRRGANTREVAVQL